MPAPRTGCATLAGRDRRGTLRARLNAGRGGTPHPQADVQVGAGVAGADDARGRPQVDGVVGGGPVHGRERRGEDTLAWPLHSTLPPATSHCRHVPPLACTPDADAVGQGKLVRAAGSATRHHDEVKLALGDSHTAGRKGGWLEQGQARRMALIAACLLCTRSAAPPRTGQAGCSNRTQAEWANHPPLLRQS